MVAVRSRCGRDVVVLMLVVMMLVVMVVMMLVGMGVMMMLVGMMLMMVMVVINILHLLFTIYQNIDQKTGNTTARIALGAHLDTGKPQTVDSGKRSLRIRHKLQQRCRQHITRGTMRAIKE